MPEHLQSVRYSAAAVVRGGREGRARSLDGRLVVDLPVPPSMGGSAGRAGDGRASNTTTVTTAWMT